MRLHKGKIILAMAASLFAFTTHAQDADGLKILKDYGWLVAPAPDKLDLTDAEKEAFLAGVKAHLNGEAGPTDPNATWQSVQQYLGQRFVENNKKAGVAFLAALDANPNVKKTKSGLYYEIIEAGEGPTAGSTDSVKVNYKGTLVDGTEFDSSYKRGEPAIFPVSGVVPGFGEGVQLVGKGGKVKLYIPSELGYGDTPRQGSPIPPGSTLIFDVEMVEVNPQ